MALDNSRLEPWLGRFVVGNEGKTMPCLPPMTGSISLSGWWYTYPSEKYESQLGSLFPIYGKIKNVPNHQPVVQPMVIWGVVCFTHITSTYPKILWLIIISRFHGGRNTMDSLCPNSNSRKQHCPFGTQSQPIIRHDKPSKQHTPSSTSINHDDPT